MSLNTLVRQKTPLDALLIPWRLYGTDWKLLLLNKQQMQNGRLKPRLPTIGYRLLISPYVTLRVILQKSNRPSNSKMLLDKSQVQLMHNPNIHPRQMAKLAMEETLSDKVNVEDKHLQLIRVTSALNMMLMSWLETCNGCVPS